MFRKKCRCMFLAVMTVFSLVACGQPEEVPTVQKPEQELMFLLKHDNYSEEEIHSASLITTDGKRITIPDDILGKDGDMSEDWAEQLIELAENTLVECTIPEEDLAVMYDFVNSADVPDVPVFKEYAEIVYDAGVNTLYLLEKETDGSYVQRKLCTTGESNKYIDDDKVIDFCNFMNEKHYFGFILG